MIRSSERPATHNCRPVSRATSPSVTSRAALDAKLVTTTRPRALPTTSSIPRRTSASEPDACLLKMLVESQINASTPASPIATRSASVAGFPSSGAASSFQSPEWNTRPCGVSISSALASGIECDIGTKVKPNGPTWNGLPGWTIFSVTRPSIRSSSSLPRISPAVNGEA